MLEPLFLKRITGASEEDPGTARAAITASHSHREGDGGYQWAVLLLSRANSSQRRP